jgi:hypothetical protein
MLGGWRRIDRRYAIHDLAYASALSKVADRVFIVSDATAYLLFNLADIDLRDSSRFFTQVEYDQYLPISEYDAGYADAEAILRNARLEIMEMPIKTQTFGDFIREVVVEATQAGVNKQVGSLVSTPAERRYLTAVSGFYTGSSQAHLQLRLLPYDETHYVQLAFEKENLYNGRVFWSGGIYITSQDQIQVFVSNPSQAATLELAYVYAVVQDNE